MTRLSLIAVLLGFFHLVSCREETKTAIETAPVTFKKEGELSMYKGGTDSVLVRLDIEIADSDYETQTGLMYRDAMKAQQGMLFIFEEEAMHSFYMKNTKIPLDLLFIDHDMKLASTTENAQPLDESGITSRVPIQYVLEVNAGMVAKWGLKAGDSISFTRN
jgi:hypothetical protein